MNNLKDKVLEFIRENGSTYIYELKGSVAKLNL